MERYNFICKNSESSAGCVKNDISFNVNKCPEITLLNSMHLWIAIQTKYGSVVTSVIYRHPVATLPDIDNFRELNEIFYMLNGKKETFFCLRDSNVDFIQISNNEAILQICKHVD